MGQVSAASCAFGSLLPEGSTHLPLPIIALSLKSSGLKLNIPSVSLRGVWSIVPPAVGMVPLRSWGFTKNWRWAQMRRDAQPSSLLQSRARMYPTLSARRASKHRQFPSLLSSLQASPSLHPRGQTRRSECLFGFAPHAFSHRRKHRDACK